MLLNEQKGLSIWMKERPFFRQVSSTRGVFSTMITGVISSSSILPSGVFAGSMSPFLSAASSDQRRLQWRKQIALPDQRDSPDELLGANCYQTIRFHRRQWRIGASCRGRTETDNNSGLVLKWTTGAASYRRSLSILWSNWAFALESSQGLHCKAPFFFFFLFSPYFFPKYFNQFFFFF